jgi:hypothetical protein
MDRIENDTSNISYIVAVFVATVTFPPSRFLPRAGEYTEIETDGWDFMAYAVEMGSGPIMQIPSFIQIGSSIQKLMGGEAQRQRGDRINLLSYFQNKESRLIK